MAACVRPPGTTERKSPIPNAVHRRTDSSQSRRCSHGCRVAGVVNIDAKGTVDGCLIRAPPGPRCASSCRVVWVPASRRSPPGCASSVPLSSRPTFSATRCWSAAERRTRRSQGAGRKQSSARSSIGKPWQGSSSGDLDQLRELESMTHPAIAAEIRRRVEAASAPAVVVELPVSSQLAGPGWALVVVVAPQEERVRRALARGGDEADVRLRMAAQTHRRGVAGTSGPRSGERRLQGRVDACGRPALGGSRDRRRRHRRR